MHNCDGFKSGISSNAFPLMIHSSKYELESMMHETLYVADRRGLVGFWMHIKYAPRCRPGCNSANISTVDQQHKE